MGSERAAMTDSRIASNAIIIDSWTMFNAVNRNRHEPCCEPSLSHMRILRFSSFVWLYLVPFELPHGLGGIIEMPLRS